MDRGRPLWKRIQWAARRQNVDLFKYITVPEAARLPGLTLSAVRQRLDWLESVTLAGRVFVLRNRAEWLGKFRAGMLPSNDLMAESLAPFDVHAGLAEIQRQKDQEAEDRRRKAEADRPRGFHVDAYGKFWCDYDANDTWIPTRYAITNLNRTRNALYALGARGRIRRRWADPVTWQPVEPPVPGQKGARGSSGPQAMWSLRDIEKYCDRRESRGRSRDFSFDDPDHPFTPTRVYEPERSAHERKLITRAEAAEILGVQTPRVSDLITAGKLKAYSRIPHRKGVPILMSEDEVVAYANKPDRRERRERYLLTRMAQDMGTWEKKQKANFMPTFDSEVIDYGRSLKTDRGEYYTLKQAAQWLDCSPNTVRDKIKNGVLKGYRAENRDPNAKWNDRRWWFVKKDDLHAYKRSPDYRRRRETWLNHQGAPRR